MATVEQLTAFFRRENEKMDLPDDFGIDRAGMNRIYIWALGSSGSERRSVELYYYPEDGIAQVSAVITPPNFFERYKENRQVIANLDISDFEVKKNFLLQALCYAAEVARSESLLPLEFSEAMPSRYRSAL